MAKYIIDIPDDGKCQYRYNEDTKELRFPCPRLDPNSFMGLDITISGATPYTEPDREAIEDEVWELVRVIADLDGDDYEIVFGEDDRDGRFFELSYQEAKAKYEEWKKEKEEIHIGDEVQYSLAGYEYTFIVFGKENDTLYGIRSDCEDGLDDLDDIYDGWETCYKSDNTLRKTGRHFDEVSNLLERIRE